MKLSKKVKLAIENASSILDMQVDKVEETEEGFLVWFKPGKGFNYAKILVSREGELLL